MLTAVEKVARYLVPPPVFNLASFGQNYKKFNERAPWEIKKAVEFVSFLLQNEKVFQWVMKRKCPSITNITFAARILGGLTLNNPEYLLNIGYDLFGEAMARKIQEKDPHRKFIDLREQYRFFEDGLPQEFKEGIDVLVIGSGPGASAAAVSLLRKKPHLKLVVLEAGQYFTAAELGKFTPATAMMETYRHAGLTTAFGFNKNSLYGIPIPMAEVLGGGPVINSGTAEEPPSDVIEKIMHPKIFEQFLKILKRNLKIEITAEDVWGISNSLFLETAKELGLNGEGLDGIRNEKCLGIGRCFAVCPAESKFHPGVTYLLEILQKYNTAVSANTKAIKAFFDTSGKIKEVKVQILDRETGKYKIVTLKLKEKGIVLLGAGILGDFNFLYDSGYGHQNLGKGMTIHPATETIVYFDDKKYAFHGLPQAVKVDFPPYGVAEGAFPDPATMGIASVGLYGENLINFLNLYPHLGVMGAMISDGPNSRGRIRRIFGKTMMFYHLADEDLWRMKKLTVEILKVWGQIPEVRYLKLNVWPFFNSKIDADFRRLGFIGKNELNEFSSWLLHNKLSFPVFAFHPLGTLLLVIKNLMTGEIKGIPNLYVVDGSAIPMTKTNPMVTIGVTGLYKGSNIPL